MRGGMHGGMGGGMGGGMQKEFQVILMFPGYKALALVSMTKVAECAEEYVEECQWTAR